MRTARLPLIALLLSCPPAWAQLDVPAEPVLPPPPTLVPEDPAAQPGQPPPPAAAVTPPAPAAPPPAPGTYRSAVHASPTWTQDRSFTSTRFWLMDPGQYEVQVWWRQRYFDHSTGAPNEHLFQAEVEIGVAPHLQIDIYENMKFNADENGNRNLEQEGVQLEARIAIPSYYGQMPLNPVIYVEWHPRHNNPDRAELRLLLGGAPTSWLYLAMNPYVETNVEKTDIYTAGVDGQGMPTVLKSSKFIADAEAGSTFAAGFRVTDWFRLSAEAKIGVDMLGSEENKFTFVAYAGPGFILKPFKSQRLKIMGTCLFGIAGQAEGAQRYEPLLIVGSQW